MQNVALSLPNFLHIFNVSNTRHGDEIDLLLHGEINVCLILWADCRQVFNNVTGKVDSLDEERREMSQKKCRSCSCISSTHLVFPEITRMVSLTADRVFQTLNDRKGEDSIIHIHLIANLNHLFGVCSGYFCMIPDQIRVIDKVEIVSCFNVDGLSILELSTPRRT